MLMGFGLQFTALSALVLYPLLHPAALPTLFREAPVPIVSFAPAPEPVRQSGTATSPDQPPVVVVRTLTQPTSIPTRVSVGPDVAPPVLIGANTCHAGCATIGIPDTGSSSQPTLAVGPTHIVVSHLQEGQIMSQVQPVYPAIARATRTQGTVVLHATIGRDGAIENLRVVTGQPLLNEAALAAVSQWKFRPYILNGSPIAVETEIMINFKLAE
jgi:protein TonB